MKEYFQKIYIKSESDLPKETHYHLFASLKQVKEGEPYFGNVDFIKSIPVDKTNIITGNESYWLNHVDWYLQPISHPDQEASELRSELIKFCYERGLDMHVKVETWVDDYLSTRK
jgi:hypothetical protein